MTAIRPEEISSIIQKEIKQYETELKMESVGVVLTVGDGIARVYGLEGVMAGELVEFPGNLFGLTLNLEQDNVGIAVPAYGATYCSGAGSAAEATTTVV